MPHVWGSGLASDAGRARHPAMFGSRLLSLTALATVLLAAASASADDEAWAVWVAGTEGPLWTLAFTPRESSDTAITFVCRAGSGKIRFHAPVHEATPLEDMELVSGEVGGLLPGGAVDNDVIGWMLTGRTTIRHPVMREFARTGLLRYRNDGEMNVRTPAEKAEVARFFKGCRGGTR